MGKVFIAINGLVLVEFIEGFLIWFIVMFGCVWIGFIGVVFGVMEVVISWIFVIALD